MNAVSARPDPDMRRVRYAVMGNGGKSWVTSFTTKREALTYARNLRRNEPTYYGKVSVEKRLGYQVLETIRIEVKP